MKAKKAILAALVLGLACAAMGTAQASQIIKRDAVLAWSTSAPGQKGALKILMVDGLYFEAEQTNEANKAAGAIKLYGAIIDGGRRVVLINTSQWKEVWDGAVQGSEISGNLVAGSATYTFKIGAAVAMTPAAVSTAPFVVGKTLKWESNAMGGQNGTVYVSAVSGSTFKLEQKNAKNASAGITKLDGEFKDGKVYIYNRQWNETWTGTLSGGVLSGKINNQYNFKIYE